MKTQIRGTPEVDEKLWEEATRLANEFGGVVHHFFKTRGDTEFSAELVVRALGMVLATDKAMPFEHQLGILLRAREITQVVHADATQSAPSVPQ